MILVSERITPAFMKYFRQESREGELKMRLTDLEGLVEQARKERGYRSDLWSDYVNDLVITGFDGASWKYRAEREDVQMTQLACFVAVMNERRINRVSVTMMVLAWMLAQMLKEAPKYIK